MRSVLYKRYIPAEWYQPLDSFGKSKKEGTGCWEPEFTQEGHFHAWGSGYEEFESGPGNYTVALVENLDGTIEEVLPSNIKFIS